MTGEIVICKGGCNRPLRPWGTRIADYPGTTSRFMKDICEKCATGKGGKKPAPVILPRPEQCLECGRRMTAHPYNPEGWARHGGRGYCQACHKRLKRRGLLPPKGTPHDMTRGSVAPAQPGRKVFAAEPEKADPALAKYLAARRARAQRYQGRR